MKNGIIFFVATLITMGFFQNCSDFSPQSNGSPNVTLDNEPETNQENLVGKSVDINANTSITIELDLKYNSGDYSLTIDAQPENGEAIEGIPLVPSSPLSITISPNRTFLGEDILRYSIREKKSQRVAEEGKLTLNIVFSGDKFVEVGPWIAGKTCLADGGGISTSWTFFAGKFLWTTNVYDAACTGIIATHQGSGDYKLGASFVNAQGLYSRNIDFFNTKHFIFVRSPIAANSFNATNACGFSDWTTVGVGSQKVVTGRDCSELNINASPTAYQSLAFEIKDNQRILYGAELSEEMDGSTIAKRSNVHLIEAPMAMNTTLIEILYFPVGDYNYEGVSYRTDGVTNYCRYPAFNPAYGNMFAFEFSAMENRFQDIGICN